MAFPIQTLSQLRPILVGFRKSAGLTQAALAARLGVTQQTYAQLESSPTSVSVERLFKVLNALDVNLVLDRRAHDATAAAPARSDTNRKRASTRPDAPAVAEPGAPYRAGKAGAERGKGARKRVAAKDALATPNDNAAAAGAGSRTKAQTAAATPKPRITKRENW